MLVADSDRYLHVIENGEVLSSILLNSIVTAVRLGVIELKPFSLFISAG